jgi:hypothetical protein
MVLPSPHLTASPVSRAKYEGSEAVDRQDAIGKCDISRDQKFSPIGGDELKNEQYENGVPSNNHYEKCISQERMKFLPNNYPVTR